MKEGIHEGCIEQIQRLYAKDYSLERKLLRMKRKNSCWWLGMRPDVQEKIAELWQEATTENLADLGI
jgi:enoyl-[acyl-carrier protein] reductase/trans-2-enoyl-CoA reductase (NAD+)